MEVGGEGERTGEGTSVGGGAGKLKNGGETGQPGQGPELVTKGTARSHLTRGGLGGREH